MNQSIYAKSDNQYFAENYWRVSGCQHLGLLVLGQLLSFQHREAAIALPLSVAQRPSAKQLLLTPGILHMMDYVISRLMLLDRPRETWSGQLHPLLVFAGTWW